MIYVRCINYPYNNVAKGIHLLGKKHFFCLYRKSFMQVRAFERYISSRHEKRLITSGPGCIDLRQYCALSVAFGNVFI